jgi:acetyl-CoA synthetase (ADP-forming)
MCYGDIAWAGAGDGIDDAPAPTSVQLDLAGLPGGALTEMEVKRLLAGVGVPVNRGELARSASEAVSAAERLGYPVALKTAHRGLVHKSDVGGVRLNLRDGQAVSRAFAEIARDVEAASEGGTLSGCLVQEMVDGGLELIIGVRREAGIGPVVLVGAGGVLTELLRDTAVAVAPVNRARALALLRRLRVWPLLEGMHGRYRLDVEAVADIVTRIGALAVALGGRLVDLEVNPLIVRPARQGAVAVDGRATLATAARHPAEQNA